MADTTDAQADWRDNAEYAGFFARLIAALLDTVVLMLPLSLLFSWLFVAVWGGANFGEAEAARIAQAQGDPLAMQAVMQQLAAEGHFSRWIMENLIFTTVSGALVILTWYLFSASPGKLMLGMKIVDATTGKPPRNGQNIGRYLGYFVSMLGIFLGFLWVGFDPRKQGWHDKMAGTVVVYKRSLPPELAALTHYAEDKRKDG